MWVLLSDDFGVGIRIGGVLGGGNYNLGFILGICLGKGCCNTYVLRYVLRS